MNEWEVPSACQRAAGGGQRERAPQGAVAGERREPVKVEAFQVRLLARPVHCEVWQGRAGQDGLSGLVDEQPRLSRGSRPDGMDAVDEWMEGSGGWAGLGWSLAAPGTLGARRGRLRRQALLGTCSGSSTTGPSVAPLEGP